MPNGFDKNWVRFCAAVDGFFAEHGHWPTKIRIFPRSVDDLRSLFRRESFDRITAKLEIVPDEAPFIAEDDEGHSYNYGDQGFFERQIKPNAEEWLGVRPDKKRLDFD